MLENLFRAIKALQLPAFVFIGILLIVACVFLFPGRLGQLLGFINRQYFAALFVFVLFWITEMDPQDKPLVLGCALIGAGMAS